MANADGILDTFIGRWRVVAVAVATMLLPARSSAQRPTRGEQRTVSSRGNEVRRVAVPVILPRAVVIWGLTRLIVAALPATAGAAVGSMTPPPVAVAVLAGILGLIDLRVRGERLLWANLGVPSAVLFALYGAAALSAEWLLALVLALR